MFGPLLGAVRADIDRQIGWAKEEAKRQRQHVLLVGIMLGAAALAMLGALAVGLIALHMWLMPRYGPFITLGIIAGGLLLLALILLLLAINRRRPRLAARPPVQMAQPAAVLGILGQNTYGKVALGGERALSFGSENIREGSRSTLLVTLAFITVLGLIAGRNLRR